ncbi:MAG: hypothetical protein KW806_00585 [Candidatus Yanofskybacteria bacterium]|nr:hypothetical protein [Candidatus Yanofskybacteria bacterium]
MKKVIVFVFMLAAFGTFAAAQEEVPLKPKAPTASQGKMIVADAARTAIKLKEVEEKLAEVDEQFTVTQSSIVAHNAVHPSGTCVAPVDNPNVCDGWVAEGGQLNTTMIELAREREKQKFRKAELRGNLNMRLARLRMMVLLDGLTEWEREVVACSKLGKDADRGCLIAAWEHHP